MHGTSATVAPTALVAEHLFEVITEIATFTEAGMVTAPPEFKTCIAVRRWLEVLAVLPVGAELIVGRTFSGSFRTL